MDVETREWFSHSLLLSTFASEAYPCIVPEKQWCACDSDTALIRQRCDRMTSNSTWPLWHHSQRDEHTHKDTSTCEVHADDGKRSRVLHNALCFLSAGATQAADQYFLQDCGAGFSVCRCAAGSLRRSQGTFGVALMGNCADTVVELVITRFYDIHRVCVPGDQCPPCPLKVMFPQKFYKGTS